MVVTILNDNVAGSSCHARYGLSYLVEADKKILFDTGPDDTFLRNAQILGVSLDDVDTIVLSHGHWDHGNGLSFLENKKIICHPACFMKRYRQKEGHYIGLNQDQEKISSKHNLILSKEPYKISDQIIFLGEIPRVNDYESKTTSFLDDEGKEDFVPDDSGIAISTTKGLFVISGCAHSGICNIISHAKKVTGISTVHAVAGGFHLKKADHVLDKTIAFLKEENVHKIYPGHCTGFIPQVKLYETFRSKQVHTGELIYLEEDFGNHT